MTRIEWPGLRFWLTAGIATAAAFIFLLWNPPAKADARYHQVLACQVAILMQLPDPDAAKLPIYLNEPRAFTREETNTPNWPDDGTMMQAETFEFHAPDDAGNMERHGAFCTYDAAGRLDTAVIEY